MGVSASIPAQYLFGVFEALRRKHMVVWPHEREDAKKPALGKRPPARPRPPRALTVSKAQEMAEQVAAFDKGLR